MAVTGDATPRRGLLSSLIRFGLSGLLSFALNLGITALLHEALGAPEELAFGVALVAVFATNFLVCRFFVFDAGDGSARDQLVGYALSSLGFRSAEYLAFLVVHSWLGVSYPVAIFCILVVSMQVKFVFFRHVVFRPGAAEGGFGRLLFRRREG